jgi:hypothetical protein
VIQEWNACRLAAALALLGLAPVPASGQGAAPAPPTPSLTPTAAVVQRPLAGFEPSAPLPGLPSPPGEPQPAAPAGVPAPADRPPEAAPPPEPWFQHARFDSTWLPPAGGGRSFGINDQDLSATFAVPTAEEWAPVLLTPGFAVRSWSGPRSEAVVGHPDLPPEVYDLNLDMGWRPRLARWLFADLGVTPGLYGDFHRIDSHTFRPRGRAVGVVAFSPELQLVAGVLYINRLHAKIMPAGGVLWRPNEDTRYELLFPQPKGAWKLATTGTTQWWGYVAGEFGGGTWTVEQAGGRPDVVDYRDLRLLLGMEWLGPAGYKAHVEVGYAFQREIRFISATPEFAPEHTLLVRAGFGF